jgi:hypothetical protein
VDRFRFADIQVRTRTGPTFEKAKPNVRINGKKFEDLKDEDDGMLSLEFVRGNQCPMIKFEFRQRNGAV